jgi:HAE1 family hydrophobic/amphiphilic exporter-1
VSPAPFSSFVTSRPVAVLMVFLAAVVFGYLSLGQLPITLMPELTYPTITVRTEYPGAAPEEVENDISRPIEESLGVIAGLQKISSISRAGMSDVVLEFAWDTDISDGTQSVLEKLDLVFLPEEAGRPLILHYDPSLDPVLELSLSGKGARFEGEAGLRRLRRLADLQIKKELEPIKGVAAVRVRGGLEEEIHVLLEEESLRRSGISIQLVISRLAQENINVAGGTLKEGRTEYLVRTLNEFQNLKQIEETIVARFGNRDVRVKDLGRVRRAHKEREILTRTDGGESVQVEIFKEGDANIVALAKRVRGALGSFQPPTVAPAADDSKNDDGEGGGAGEESEGGDDDETTAGVGPRGGPRQADGLVAKLHNEEGATLSLVADRSLFIESSIKEVRNTAVLGGLLAVLVLFLFLRNWKSTIIIAVSIPISLLITFAPLHLLGVTLNVMSLGGLALGVGMLVDSSIVVLESIYRCREEGDDIVAGANRGTAEVRGAVFASTLTSIAVFFPMVFVEGIAGQAFGDLGFAVVVSLLAAAAVALFFIPMLASRQGVNLRISERMRAPQLRHYVSFGNFRQSLAGWRRLIRPKRLRGWRVIFAPLVWPVQLVVGALAPLYWVIRLLLGVVIETLGKLILILVMATTFALGVSLQTARFAIDGLLWPAKKLTDAMLRGLSDVYPRVLRGALARPLVVVLAVAACFWATWEVTSSLQSELLPEVHQGEFTVEVALPVGTPVEETLSIVDPIERAILTEKEQIQSLLLTVGYDSANSQRSDEGEHTARFKVLLDELNRGAEIEEQVIGRLRDQFANVPDLDARIVRPVLFSSKTPIEVEVHGNDLREIKKLADRVQEEMAALPELADVESSLRSGAPEVQVVYDRDRLSVYGLNIREVAQLVRDKVQGFEATRFNLKDRRIPILVRLSMDDRETVQDVREVIVNPGGDRPIRLASVAEITLGEGPSEVRRIDGRRVAVVRASIASGSLSGATERIDSRLRTAIDWPGGMTFLITGQNEEWVRSRLSLWIALGLSVFLVYVIMAAQFESLIHPLVIMLTIPLAFFGTVITLKLLGLALSIVVFLGMIMLAGIVVNNAIVLVDYINTLRRRGLPRDDAILQAGSVRLRPILMRTTTTVLGLTPMALGLGDGAEIRTPMAIAVISGLISSTALTLVVIPSVYALADSIKQKLVGRKTVRTADESDVVGLPDADSGALTL